MRKSFLIFSLFVFATAFVSISFLQTSSLSQSNSALQKTDSSEVDSAKLDIRQEFFDTLLCDGFDFPIGDKNAKGNYTSLANEKTYTGWFRATKTGEEYFLGIHTGEDWNGSGGGNTDLGQPVYATAGGIVVHAAECPSPWGNVIMIEHHLLENGKLKIVYSQYAHLKELFVKKGETVKRRQKIGSIGQGNNKEYPAHLHFEIRKENMKAFDVDYWPSSHNQTIEWVKEHYYDCTQFINEHRKLIIPKQLKKFAITVKSEFKCFYYEDGELKKTYDIALGQEPMGAKEIQGDLKVPEGEYQICEKTVGPFKGDWVSAYLGARWIRLNYPNIYDAKRGLEQKLITQEQYNTIVAAVKQNKIPPKGTKLG